MNLADAATSMPPFVLSRWHFVPFSTAKHRPSFERGIEK